MQNDYQKSISSQIVFYNSAITPLGPSSLTMSEVARRLQVAMDSREVSQSALAKAVGITQGAINAILSGKTRKSKHLPEIATFLGVSLMWLMGSSSEMEPDRAQEVLLHPVDREVIDNWRVLGPFHQRLVRDLLQDLAVAELAKAKLLRLLPNEAELASILTDIIGPLDLARPVPDIAGECAGKLRTALILWRDFSEELQRSRGEGSQTLHAPRDEYRSGG